MNEPTLKDILEILNFIKDNAAMRDEVATKEDMVDVRNDLADVKLDIKKLHQDVFQTKHDMISHVDGFVGLYRKHESELAAVVYRQDRFDETLKKIVKHLGLEPA